MIYRKSNRKRLLKTTKVGVPPLLSLYEGVGRGGGVQLLWLRIFVCLPVYSGVPQISCTVSPGMIFLDSPKSASRQDPSKMNTSKQDKQQL